MIGMIWIIWINSSQPECNRTGIDSFIQQKTEGNTKMNLTYFKFLSILLTFVETMQGSADNFWCIRNETMSADPVRDDTIYNDRHWISESNTRRIQHKSNKWACHTGIWRESVLSGRSRVWGDGLPRTKIYLWVVNSWSYLKSGYIDVGDKCMLVT